MRVLLFVQDGNARPTCVTARSLNRIRVNGEWFLTEQEAWRQKWADRWWLVECENADAGRFMIDPAWTGGRCSWPPPQGRILASGGRQQVFRDDGATTPEGSER